MKKLASILLAALTGLLFWHCGDSKDDDPKPDDNIGGEVAPENNENPETAQDGKMLVVFFSLSARRRCWNRTQQINNYFATV